MRKGERQGVGDRYRDTVTKIEKIIFLILFEILSQVNIWLSSECHH